MKSAAQNLTASAETTNPFPHKEYDITNICGQIFVCFGGPYKSILNLEPEFAVIEETTICGVNRRRVPYGEMSVDRVTFCCFTSINGWTPGCGCQTQKVNDIALTSRKESEHEELLDNCRSRSSCKQRWKDWKIA
jgi:hypothetical protein